MLDTLEAELLAQVMGHLLAGGRHMPSRIPEEARNARLACRALDAAFHLHHATALTLAPEMCTSDTAPRLAHFPKLLRLRLQGWDTSSSVGGEQQLLACFERGEPGRPTPGPGAGEAVGSDGKGGGGGGGGSTSSSSGSGAAGGFTWGVRKLQLVQCQLGGATVQLLAEKMPGVASIEARHNNPEARRSSEPALLALFPATFSGLQRLVMCDLDAGAEAAQALARLPSLRALALGGVEGEDAWRQLPAERLTSLALRHGCEFSRGFPGPEASRFSRLVEARGLTRRAGAADDLARAAPGLRLLVCAPVGGGWGECGACFPGVTHASFYYFERNLTEARLARMLPAVEHLALWPDPMGDWFGDEMDEDESEEDSEEGSDDAGGGPRPPGFKVDLAGLTGLRSLGLYHRRYWLDAADARAASRMARLTALACALDQENRTWRGVDCQMARLAGLTSLMTLELALNQADQFLPLEVVDGVARPGRLHTLRLGAACDDWNFFETEWPYEDLVRFVRSPAPVRRLCICPSLDLPGRAALLLSTHPTLERLEVNINENEWNGFDEFDATRGNQIVGGPMVALSPEESMLEPEGTEVCPWVWELEPLPPV